MVGVTFLGHVIMSHKVSKAFFDNNLACGGESRLGLSSGVNFGLGGL